MTFICLGRSPFVLRQIGFLCGHFCQKRGESAVETVPPADSGQTQIPYYDDVFLQQHDEPELELSI